jgi:hypothetical protein
MILIACPRWTTLLLANKQYCNKENLEMVEKSHSQIFGTLAKTQSLLRNPTVQFKPIHPLSSTAKSPKSKIFNLITFNKKRNSNFSPRLRNNKTQSISQSKTQKPQFYTFFKP